MFKTTVRRSGLFLSLLLLSLPAFSQQEKGDNEVGISGSLNVSHSQPISGQFYGALSYGRFMTRSQYFGVTLNPFVTIENKKTSVGGFFGANYRYLFGAKDARVFPFAGMGGGIYSMGGGGSKSSAGSGFGEIGLKSFISPKTSFEFSYQLLYVKSPSGGFGQGGGFARDSRSIFMVSLRQLF